MIDIIAQAGPNAINIAPTINVIELQKKGGSALCYRLLHTGQHYDTRMAAELFTQLEIPEAGVHLDLCTGNQAEQTTKIMTRYEKLLLVAQSDLCLVVSNANSTMTCATTVQKCFDTAIQRFSPAIKTLLPSGFAASVAERIVVVIEELLCDA